MKIKCLFLVALILAVTSISFAQAKTKVKASGIRSVDFLNYSYRSSVCSEDLGTAKTVKFRKGRFKAAGNFFNIIGNKVIYADADGDGSEDAILQIICGASNSSTLRLFEIPVYSFQNGRAKLLAKLDNKGLENDYQKYYPDGFLFVLAENDVKVKNGHLIVEVLADGSYADPENIATFDYEMSGGKFVLSGKPTIKPIK